MQPEFRFQVVVASAGKQRFQETVNPFAKDAHRFLPHVSPWSSAWMMPAIRSSMFLSRELTPSRRRDAKIYHREHRTSNEGAVCYLRDPTFCPANTT